jgi:hypothetical protein
MRFPRVRFTVRWMMVAVLAGLPLAHGCWSRRTHPSPRERVG